MAFESGDCVESIITAVAGAVVAVLGALTPIIKKLKNKSGKEVITTINKQEVDALKDTIKQQAKIIEKAVKEKSSPSP